VIDPTRLVTAAGWSPYSGRRVRGRVLAAFSRGRQVWDGERVMGEPGDGGFVAAATARTTAVAGA
jgi:allantoinase